MKSSADMPLLARIARGDDGAVREAIDVFGNLVWSLALRSTPTRADAEDAVQEIFLDLWRSAGRYDPTRSTESGFVALIARRRLIDMRRKAGRRPRLVAQPEGREAASSDHERIVTSVRAQEVMEVVQSLKPRQREFLEMSLIEGRSHSEIAERTNTPLGTVKTTIRRSLAEVRRRMIPEPAGSEAGA